MFRDSGGGTPQEELLQRHSVMCHGGWGVSALMPVHAQILHEAVHTISKSNSRGVRPNLSLNLFGRDKGWRR